MRERPIRAASGGLVGALVALTLPATPVRAQLADATWIEAVQLTTDLDNESHLGIDPALPEPLAGSVSGAGYAMSASISFPAAGTPNLAAAVDADYQSGLSEMGGLASSRVDFQFRVVESATPPAAVSTVPVHLHGQGAAQASGDSVLSAASYGLLTLSNQGGEFLSWSAAADNDPSGGTPTSDSFDNDDQLDLAPGDVILGVMTVVASLGTGSLESGVAASAGAQLDPVIEIADALIPGTSANFRDYFAVEFSNGYYALGQTPARTTTWGAIKRLYRN